MTGREVIKRLLADGWEEAKPRTSGRHRQFRHPVKKGKVTVPVHSGDISLETLKRIEKQSGIKMK